MLSIGLLILVFSGALCLPVRAQHAYMRLAADKLLDHFVQEIEQPPAHNSTAANAIANALLGDAPAARRDSLVSGLIAVSLDSATPYAQPYALILLGLAADTAAAPPSAAATAFLLGAHERIENPAARFALIRTLATLDTRPAAVATLSGLLQTVTDDGEAEAVAHALSAMGTIGRAELERLSGSGGIRNGAAALIVRYWLSQPEQPRR